MSKVLTFSRTFPAYHPKAGQPTHFVEKFWKSIEIADITGIPLPKERDSFCFGNHVPKHHTIRAGKRWKVGDKFSPRVWSGRPYHSKQIILAPDVEVVKVWDITIEGDDEHFGIEINGSDFCGFLFCFQDGGDNLNRLAANDGLSSPDLLHWFRFGRKVNFTGQIICWNHSINY